MSEILKPREFKLFEFMLTDDERENLIKDLETKINRWEWNKKGASPKNIIRETMGNLCCKSGWQDHALYMLDKAGGIDIREQIQEHLCKRAYLSALLQSFVESVNDKGYDTGIKEFDGEVESPMVEINTIYHGTPDPTLTLEAFEHGRNKDGIILNRDGVGYYTTAREKAEKVIKGCVNVLEKDLTDKDKSSMAVMDHTDGYTPYFYQEELMKLSEDGIRFLYSYRYDKERNLEVSPQILDITNFAAFVEERDSAITSLLERHNLRLPDRAESLKEYLEAIGVDQEHYNKFVSGFLYDDAPNHGESAEKIKFDEMFPDLNQEPTRLEMLSNTCMALREKCRALEAEMAQAPNLAQGRGSDKHEI